MPFPSKIAFPEDVPMFKLATIRIEDEPGLIVHWGNDKVFFQVKSEAFRANGGLVRDYGYNVVIKDGKVLYDEPLHEWWVMDDMNVRDSLTNFYTYRADSQYYKNLMIYDSPGNGQFADAELQIGVYDCDWSDFACDKLYLEFAIATGPCEDYPYNSLKRAGFAIAARNDIADDQIECDCSCIDPKPKKTANAACNISFVGDTCRGCQKEIPPNAHAAASCDWALTMADYQGTYCLNGCSTIMTEDRVGDIRCESCWSILKPQCVCLEPVLSRMERWDGQYAKPTCGGCNRFVPEHELAQFEREVVEFVEATEGRL
jgi:hypothetical protein